MSICAVEVIINPEINKKIKCKKVLGRSIFIIFPMVIGSGVNIQLLSHGIFKI